MALFAVQNEKFVSLIHQELTHHVLTKRWKSLLKKSQQTKQKHQHQQKMVTSFLKTVWERKHQEINHELKPQNFQSFPSNTLHAKICTEANTIFKI